MTPTLSTEKLVQLVIEDIWNRADTEMAGELFTDDYVNHGGLIPDVIHGPEAIRFSVALYRRAFPAFEITVDQVESSGEAIEVRWTAHDRPLGPGDSPGAEACLRGITRCRVVAGRIAESWTVWKGPRSLMRFSGA